MKHERIVVEQAKPALQERVEHGLESILFASRWLMAPFYLLMVLFAGYENFVSKMDIGDHKDRPDWMGKVDFAGLKLKLVASIVAISGINLLKHFMALSPDHMSAAKEHQLFWMVIIHLVFIASGVMLAYMDKIVAVTKTHQ